MSALGCCRAEELPPRLNDQQRSARTTVGITALGVALLVRPLEGPPPMAPTAEPWAYC